MFRVALLSLLLAGRLEAAPFAIERVSDRSAFLRMEPAGTIRLAVRNTEAAPSRPAVLRLSLTGPDAQDLPLPALAPGTAHEVAWKVDTRLRPDTYTLTAKVGDQEERIPVVIAARPLPHTLPVLMWGTPTSERERRLLKEMGFTHFLITLGDHAKVWKDGAPGPAAEPAALKRLKQRMDTALGEGFYVYGYVFPGRWARKMEELQRVGPDGKPYNVEAKRRDICALSPEMERLCRDVGASVAQSFAHLPALQGFDIHSETRDAARPCFHPADREAYRKAAGSDIPAEALAKDGVRWTKLPGFPADRVIADDHPLYRYYKWFWTEGDGWIRLNDAVHDGLKSAGRTDWLTYYGPATRVPSLFGGGGKLDALNNWTYVHPDPIRIGLNVDEMLAMAKGAPRPQGVTMGIQAICYRSLLAPSGGEKPAGAGSAWEDSDAAYITVPPMLFREAFWAEIARPLAGLMSHGFESLFPADKPNVYQYTHPETQIEVKRLLNEVVRPLGPTLVQVPDAPADVAFLESFASQMFAGRGTYGWGHGWAGALYQALQYAQLQPEVFYEETVQRRGLDGVRVLVMPDCDVLPRSVVERIRAFQARGGIAVGDERLCPGVKADILLEIFDRPTLTRTADQDKTRILALAARLRKELDPRYTRAFEADNPEVVTRRRRAGEADALFVVNDRRAYGDYVGRYGTAMENGLPSDATLTLRRAGGAVYDLVEHRPVPAKVSAGRLQFATHLGPCEGRIYLVLPRPIARVAVKAPAKAARGGSADVVVSVLDARGQPARGVVPLEIEIRDPAGRPAERSGHYGARDGVLRIRLDVAPNDAAGKWEIRARELASGKVVRQPLSVSN